LGINHDHFFSFRLDLDVDGQNNSFMIHRLVEKDLPAGSPRKSIWVPEPSIAQKESGAMMDIHLEKPSMWIFVNPNVKGPLGHPTGYELMPGVTAASLLSPEDGVQESRGIFRPPVVGDTVQSGGTLCCRKLPQFKHRRRRFGCLDEE
jgi:primary-amine oxidase